MPHIDVPQAFTDRVSQVDMQLGFPQQSVLRSPWTGAAQVLNRGYSRWSGLVSLVAEGSPVSARADEWGAIEAFLAALQGAANTFDLPHRRPGAAIPDDTVIANRKTEDNGELAGVLQHRLPGGNDYSGLAPGQMLNAGGRTYVVSRVLTQRWIVLYPQRIIPNTAPASASATIRVRVEGSAGVVSPLLPHRSGPWSFRWEEA